MALVERCREIRVSGQVANLRSTEMGDFGRWLDGWELNALEMLSWVKLHSLHLALVCWDKQMVLVVFWFRSKVGFKGAGRRLRSKLFEMLPVQGLPSLDRCAAVLHFNHLRFWCANQRETPVWLWQTLMDRSTFHEICGKRMESELTVSEHRCSSLHWDPSALVETSKHLQPRNCLSCSICSHNGSPKHRWNSLTIHSLFCVRRSV